MSCSPPRSTCLAALVALAVALVGCGGAGAGGGSAGEAVVVRVIDGDTVALRIDGTDEHVRLIGVDTPETVKPDTPVQCFGPEASAHTKHLLPPGTRVRVARDAEARDHFGRLLVYLWRSADGRFVNLDLAAGGFARPLRITPNTAHAPDIAAAADRARAAGTGLWGSCPPQG